MPRLADFNGVKIGIFSNDYSPSHFHAVKGGKRTRIRIDPVEVLDDDPRYRLDPADLRLVLDWARQHQRELTEGWD